MAVSKAGYRRGQKYIKNLRLYEVAKNGRSYWRLRTPRPSGTGFSERQFSSEPEARTAFEIAFLAHHNHGVSAGTLGLKERGDALGALDILRPTGTSLSEAAKYYASHHANIHQNKLVTDAVAEFLSAKGQDGLSSCYCKDLRIRLGRFVQSFGHRKMADISAGEIDTWLRELALGPSSRNTFRSRLSVLFFFARQRHWCAENVLAQVEKAKWIGTEPGILSPEEFARLLEAAGARTLPYWAIGGFAGLRSAELERLEWVDLDFERGLVEVTRSKSKTASRRHVAIRPALAAWLEPYRSSGSPGSGQVCPPGLRHHLEADRARAGISQWPSNALRHSFASYHLEHFKEINLLTVEMGHGSPDLVQRFYRQRVRPEAARAWWSILPPPAAQHKIVEGRFAACGR